MDVTVVYERGGDKNFSCFVEEDTGKCGLAGYGPSAQEAEKDMFVARNEYIEMGETVPEINIKRRKFDVGAFFDYYPINVTQFARLAGINASQLRQYASNKRKPCKKTLDKLTDAAHNLGKKLMNESYAFGID